MDIKKENLSGLKGIGIILVLLTHLDQNLSTVYYFQYIVFQVGIFLFASGYGMMAVLSGGRRSIGRTLYRRLLTLAIPFLLAAAVYIPVKAALGFFAEATLATLLFKGGSVVTHSWYVVAIAYFYIAICLVFRFCPRHVLTGLFALTVVWIGAMVISGGWLHRYVTAICFFLGAASYKYREHALPRLSRGDVMTIMALAFVVFFAISTYLWDRGNVRWYMQLMETLNSVAIVLFQAGIAVRYRIRSAFLDRLAELSLELYLLQGLFLLLYRCDWCMISSDLLYTLLVLASTYIAAELFHWLTGRLAGLLPA